MRIGGIILPESQEEQLNVLAEERADRIKTYLVTELGADGKRLIACSPYLDMDKEDANLRVDLLI